MSRISKRDYYLAIARTVALRSTCIRRQYGAVIVVNERIVSTGYNGSCRGEANCCDRGYCERETLNVPHGERYELCRGVHAEENACLSAGREACLGGTLYLAGFDQVLVIDAPQPCAMCARAITQVGIVKVIS